MFRLEERSFKKKVVLTRVSVLVVKDGFLAKSTVHWRSMMLLSTSLAMISVTSWSRVSILSDVRSMLIWHDIPCHTVPSLDHVIGSMGNMRLYTPVPPTNKTYAIHVLAAANEAARRGKSYHLPWHVWKQPHRRSVCNLRVNLMFSEICAGWFEIWDVLLTVELITRCEPKL